MKKTESDGVIWFLEREELLGVIKKLPKGENLRRGYSVLDHGNERLFVKSFREKGVPGFVRNRVLPRGKKEFNGGRRLLSLGIPTPTPLGYGVSRTGSFVIQEWLDGRTFLDEFLLSSGQPPLAPSGHGGPTRKELLVKLAEFLSTLKKGRVRHNDLHLNNILICGDTFLLIDLHKMRIKRTFALDDEIANLTQALAMIYDDMGEDERGVFFQAYSERDVRAQVEEALARQQARWVRRKKERAFRETSLLVSKEGRLYIRDKEGQGTAQFAGFIKRDKKVVIERYSDHIRKRYGSKRRLTRAWRAHVVLAYMGLKIVPAAIYVEKPGKNAMGTIAMENLAGTGEEFDRYLDRRYDAMTDKARRVFIDRLAAFFLMLVKRKIIHRDLKACNIFVRDEGGLLLLDVEDIRFRALDEEALKRMLVQLNTTIPKRIGINDRIRFFVKFTRPMRIDRRAIFKAVVKESLRREIVYEGVKGLVREKW